MSFFHHDRLEFYQRKRVHFFTNCANYSTLYEMCQQTDCQGEICQVVWFNPYFCHDARSLALHVGSQWKPLSTVLICNTSPMQILGHKLFIKNIKFASTQVDTVKFINYHSCRTWKESKYMPHYAEKKVTDINSEWVDGTFYKWIATSCLKNVIHSWLKWQTHAVDKATGAPIRQTMASEGTIACAKCSSAKIRI